MNWAELIVLSRSPALSHLLHLLLHPVSLMLADQECNLSGAKVDCNCQSTSKVLEERKGNSLLCTSNDELKSVNIWTLLPLAAAGLPNAVEDQRVMVSCLPGCEEKGLCHSSTFGGHLFKKNEEISSSPVKLDLSQHFDVFILFLDHR